MKKTITKTIEYIDRESCIGIDKVNFQELNQIFIDATNASYYGQFYQLAYELNKVNPNLAFTLQLHKADYNFSSKKQFLVWKNNRLIYSLKIYVKTNQDPKNKKTNLYPEFYNLDSTSMREDIKLAQVCLSQLEEAINYYEEHVDVC